MANKTIEHLRYSNGKRKLTLRQGEENLKNSKNKLLNCK